MGLFDKIFEYSWLIPAVPLLSAILIAIVLRPLAARAVPMAATAAVFASMILSLVLAWRYLGSSGEHAGFTPWSFEWLKFQPGLCVKLGVLIDPISVLMMAIVTVVSFLVHLYSIGYMKSDSGYGRYFIYLNLFTFSMLGLVVAPNIIQTYICWELVGASSFLLIGFYYDRPSAVAASNKAFILTRFADLGFLLGIIIFGYFGCHLFSEVGIASADAFDFSYLTNPAFLQRLGEMPSGIFDMSLLTVAVLLVFAGAAGKSAMFPLHIWLPDAMEGPTPVSALIHAATMVVAGVYLVARLFTAFAVSGSALAVVAYVGAFTSIFAAVIAITQDDIKRVLAFSTLSQLGYMMLSLGVAQIDHLQGYGAAMFHVFTHAFFKALLFLGAGAVIHAVSTNNIWQMGGLAKKLPVTHMVFLTAVIAIAGIWPFSGFFSKDAILAAALNGGHYLLFAIGVIVAGLTALYMFRMYLVVFWGKARSDAAVHEAPVVMLVPMAVLAICSALAGFIPVDRIVSAGDHQAHAGKFLVAVFATSAAVIGIVVALVLYGTGKYPVVPAFGGLGRTCNIIKQKFYVDEIYLLITRKVIFRAVAAPVAWFDRHVVDGAVNLSAWLSCKIAAGLRRLQTGQVQVYGLWLVSGVLLVFLIAWASLR